MSGICSKCKAPLESPWSFYPRCGAESPHAPQPPGPPPEREEVPVRGAMSGLLIGGLVAPVLLIVGTLLCLTGLGAVLGVPMILGGIVAPLAGSIFGAGSVRGKCPSCGAAVSSVASKHSFACPVCGESIMIRRHELVRAK